MKKDTRTGRHGPVFCANGGTLCPNAAVSVSCDQPHLVLHVTRYGPITTATIEMFSEQGAEAIGLIRFEHTDPNGFEQYRVVIRRENNAWKISDRGQV